MPGFDKVIQNMKRKEDLEEKARGLGAGDLGVSLISDSDPNKKYRLHYGFINEKHFGDKTGKEPMYFDEQFDEAADFGDAMDKYKKLGWLRERDPKGRKFISIESSGDDFKSKPTSYFSDSQKY